MSGAKWIPIVAVLAASAVYVVVVAEGGTKDMTAAQTTYRAESRESFDGPEDWFTGDVRVALLFPANETAHYSGASVTFQPGARTAWHLHPAGQHMIVTAGIALTGTRDGTVVRFGSGDTVWCPPDVDHWHGATPHAPMTHLVITGSLDGENVVWKEKVTDEQYAASVSRSGDTDEEHALSRRRRGIVPIAAFTSNGHLDSLKTAIHAGLDAGLTINEIKEIQIHLYAYAGFPRALNGLAALMSVLEERKARGITDELGEEPGSLPADRTSIERGKVVQTELVGKPVAGPLFDFAPAVNELLQGHLFGDLFGRGVLDYPDREIATLSALASLEGVDSQLESHVRIASNVGLTKAQLAEVATVLSRTVGTREGERAKAAVHAVRR